MNSYIKKLDKGSFKLKRGKTLQPKRLDRIKVDSFNKE